jgi:GNAT superfamily N-acetyltransferase
VHEGISQRLSHKDDIGPLARFPSDLSVTEALIKGNVPRMGRMPLTMKADFAAAIRDDLIWVLIEDDWLLAVLHLRSRSDCLFIEDVAVRVDRQRRGIGKTLLAFAEEEALRRGYHEIRLCTNETMVENIALYQSLGYREIRRNLARGPISSLCESRCEMPSCTAALCRVFAEEVAKSTKRPQVCEIGVG